MYSTSSSSKNQQSWSSDCWKEFWDHLVAEKRTVYLLNITVEPCQTLAWKDNSTIEISFQRTQLIKVLPSLLQSIGIKQPIINYAIQHFIFKIYTNGNSILMEELHAAYRCNRTVRPRDTVVAIPLLMSNSYVHVCAVLSRAGVSVLGRMKPWLPVPTAGAKPCVQNPLLGLSIDYL